MMSVNNVLGVTPPLTYPQQSGNTPLSSQANSLIEGLKNISARRAEKNQLIDCLENIVKELNAPQQNSENLYDTSLSLLSRIEDILIDRKAPQASSEPQSFWNGIKAWVQETFAFISQLLTSEQQQSYRLHDLYVKIEDRLNSIETKFAGKYMQAHLDSVGIKEAADGSEKARLDSSSRTQEKSSLINDLKNQLDQLQTQLSDTQSELGNAQEQLTAHKESLTASLKDAESYEQQLDAINSNIIKLNGSVKSEKNHDSSRSNTLNYKQILNLANQIKTSYSNSTDHLHWVSNVLSIAKEFANNYMANDTKNLAEDWKNYFNNYTKLASQKTETEKLLAETKDTVDLNEQKVNKWESDIKSFKSLVEQQEQDIKKMNASIEEKSKEYLSEFKNSSEKFDKHMEYVEILRKENSARIESLSISSDVDYLKDFIQDEVSSLLKVA